MSAPPRVRIHYLRPPDREQLFEQVVVHEDPEVIVTLAESVSYDPPLVIDGAVALENGSPAVWFTFPGRWHDVGAFHRADGTFTGYYANVLTPPRIEGREWWTTDLFLDVWLSADGARRLLDEEELEAAECAGHVSPGLAARARAEAQELMARAEAGLWPPEVVRVWTLERARLQSSTR